MKWKWHNIWDKCTCYECTVYPFMHKWKGITDVWKKAIIPTETIDWDEYFLIMAILASTRSRDAQSQVGAVLVKNKLVIGTGYNSFPKHMPDTKIPNTRPYKYPWVIHAEVNALYNTTTDPSKSICYVTANPCLECLKALYQKDITTYVTITGAHTHMCSTYTDDEKATYEHFVKWGDIKIRSITLTTQSIDIVINQIQKFSGVQK